MSREPIQFVFHLTDEEVDHIRGAVGSGGQQGLHRRLLEELDERGNAISLTDAELGKLIRYMACYGSGGFQGRLKKAFGRSLGDLLRLDE